MQLKTDSRQPISILFVEDDEIILELQSSILAKSLPDVILYTAVNGRLGLELFKTHTPDIVITDINMSEMCGVQMAENIRALTTVTKIIAITGKSIKTSKHGEAVTICNPDGKTVKFDYVIVKPVDLSELFGVVEQFIGEIITPAIKLSNYAA